MNTKPDASPLTTAFVDYVFSAAGAEIIRTAGYIPLARRE
jgi:ABC-type phosphate transport system substrate-binding protein